MRWKPGERSLAHDFGADATAAPTPCSWPCRRSAAAMPARAGAAAARAGGQVRKGGKGTPILYVEWRQRRPAKGGHLTAFPASPYRGPAATGAAGRRAREL